MEPDWGGGGVYFWTFSLVATMHNRKYVVTESVVNSSSSEESQGRTESGADYVTDMLFYWTWTHTLLMRWADSHN